MESDSLHGLQHQPPSLYKSYMKNPMMEPFISRPYSKGLLKAPPLSLLHSAPTFSLQPPPQPPLLPLPASLPRRSSSCPGHSCSPAIKNGSRKTRSAHAFTPKKSTKSSTKNNNNQIPKKEEKKTPRTSPGTTKNIAGVTHFDNLGSLKDVKDDRVELLPGSAVFTISPPPSSLPLPSFSLRPKLSCNAGKDAGATDDLRRLLRLQ